MSSTESSLKIKIVKSDDTSGADSEGDYRISQVKFFLRMSIYSYFQKKKNQLCKIQKAEILKKTYDFRMKSTMVFNIFLSFSPASQYFNLFFLKKSLHLDKKQMKYARKKIAETSKSLLKLITEFKSIFFVFIFLL